MIAYNQFDGELRDHCISTELLSVRLAELMGMSGKDLTEIRVAARYHDLGKINVPIDILNKPAKLTNSEYNIVKKHPIDGYNMLDGIFAPHVRDMILYHHENVDGTGYFQLIGNDIPIGAKVIHICDVYDALITKRVYRDAWNKTKVLNYLASNAGTMFDTKILNIFLDLLV